MDQGGDILWHYQQQIFREIEMATVRLSDKIMKANMIFQLAICNILGFGTSVSVAKAIELVSQANALGHPIAEDFGQLVCSGGNVSNTYNACILRGMHTAALVPTWNGKELLRACSMAQ